MHKAEIIQVQELSDGAIGVTFRCCSDSKSVTHTFMTRDEHTEDDFNQWLEERAAEVEKQHAARSRAQEFMRSKIPVKDLIHD